MLIEFQVMMKCNAETNDVTQSTDNRLLSVDGNFDLFVIKERYEQAIKTITSISWREVEVVYMDYQLFP